uniref:Uncharacterized protein n=1 Tax=Arundo donax TaxID=35708 RepID=A0A0A9GQE9_ARUDO
MGKIIIQHSFGIQVYPYDRFSSLCWNTSKYVPQSPLHVSFKKSKDLIDVEIELKSETFTKCLLYPLL